MILHGWRQILDLLFPRACLLCRRLVVDERSPALCFHCEQDLSPIVKSCLRCGAPVRTNELLISSPSKRTDCAFCKGQRWEFGRAWSYTVYQATAARAVRLMKEAHCESLTRSVGDLLANWLKTQEAFSSVNYDCIVPIPQHWLRRLSQRYNHAATLGERLALGLDLPCSDTILRRVGWTQKQGMKTISERRENLLGAFEAPKPESVRYRSFLLVDDVMTSGATLQEAAIALRKAGARHVDAVVFARGVNASKPAGTQERARKSEDPLTFDQNTREPQPPTNWELGRRIH